MSKFTYNAAQKSAIKHNNGPIMVVAGAGTGKTAVITARIARLIQQKKALPSEILALTFTDKAAAEMQDRLDQLLDYSYSDCEVATFHGFGEKILREHSLEISISGDFSIMNQFAQSIFIADVLNTLELEYYKPLGNPYSFVGALIAFISRLKDENCTALDFAAFIRKQSSSTSKTTLDAEEKTRVRELEKIYSTYDKNCRVKACIDYGDLIIKCIEIFTSRPSILAIYQRKFKYILVDEYQDTNFAQTILLTMLSKVHQNIMVVGDDDQSIYRFRGAAVENILGFKDTFLDSKIVVLNENYRSTKEILNASYRLIQNNNPYRLEAEHGLQKKLTSKKKGRAVEVVAADTITTEMNLIAKKIKDIHKNEAIDYKDIAILVRKNKQTPVVEKALAKLGIPYQSSESQKLFEQPEVKIILSFIEIVNDSSASAALFSLLVSDYGAVDAGEVATQASLARRLNIGLESQLRSCKKINNRTEEILKEIDKYRNIVSDMSAGEIIYDFLSTSGYLDKLVEKSEKIAEYSQKVLNVSSFFSLVKEYETVAFDNSMHGLYLHLYSLRYVQSDLLTQVSPLDINAVNITTVHRSKGLEYRAVFILDLVEQAFPAKRSSFQSIRMPDGLLLAENSKIDWHISEERRLFYVASTRAKDLLFYSYSLDHGGKRLLKPSRFIAESVNMVPILTKSKSIPLVFENDYLHTSGKQTSDPVRNLYDSNGWLALSVNQVADYLRSPKEFYYFSVLNLPKGPFHTLVYGSAIHLVIESYFRNKLAKKTVSLEYLNEVFENSWKKEGFVSITHEKERFRAGLKLIARLYKVYESPEAILPKIVEEPFSIKIPSLKLIIKGRYDAIFMNSNKEIEIRDYKTGDIKDQKKAKDRLRDSIQLQIYAYAYEKNSKQAVSTISLEFVETGIIVSSKKFDHNRTFSKIEQVVMGITKRRFSASGQAFENLERLL